jgi:hypothetical protein
MSSGCLLISANPISDERVLTPELHYVYCEPDPARLRATLEEVALDPRRMRTVAQAGSLQVRDRMDVRRGVAAKLAHMGFSVADRIAGSR